MRTFLIGSAVRAQTTGRKSSMKSAGCTSCSRPSHMRTNSCRSMYVLPLANALQALMAGCRPPLPASGRQPTCTRRAHCARLAVRRTMATGSRHREKVSGMSVAAVVSAGEELEEGGQLPRPLPCLHLQSCFCFCTLHSVSTYCSRRSGRQAAQQQREALDDAGLHLVARRAGRRPARARRCCTLSCGAEYTRPSSCRLQARECTAPEPCCP